MFRNRISSFLKNVSQIIDPVNGPLTALAEQPPLPYIPNLYSYRAIFKGASGKELFGLGTDKNIEMAVTKAIAEGMERYCVANQREEAFSNVPETKKKDISSPMFKNDFNLSRYIWLKGHDINKQVVYLPMIQDTQYNTDSDIINVTSGVAAHIDFETSLSKATLELIERDAFMVRWLAQLSPCAIDVNSVRKGLFKKICKKLAHDGNEVCLYDLTIDIPVPVVAILIINEQKKVIIGLGSAWSFEEAIQHALIEALRELGKLQQTVNFDRGNAIKRLRSFELEGHSEYHWSSKDNAFFQFMLNSPKSSPYSEVVESRVWVKNISELLSFLKSNGMEWFYIKLGEKKFNNFLNIVRCVVPGLQQFIYGLTNESLVNHRRLNKLGLRWVCDTPHPIC